MHKTLASLHKACAPLLLMHYAQSSCQLASSQYSTTLVCIDAKRLNRQAEHTSSSAGPCLYASDDRLYSTVQAVAEPVRTSPACD